MKFDFEQQMMREKAMPAKWRDRGEPEMRQGPPPGDRMDDGVYAGYLDGKEIYAAPADAPRSYTFNEAATYATQLNRENYLGHDDWRVPNKQELDVLYRNQTEGALKGTFNTETYWSSLEDGDYAWAQRFSDGTQFLTDRYDGSSLRLVR